MKEQLECECGWIGTPDKLESWRRIRRRLWITDDLGGFCPQCGEQVLSPPPQSISPAVKLILIRLMITRRRRKHDFV